ncbi:hypothetical protein D3C73_962050 [compost metagenome]
MSMMPGVTKRPRASTTWWPAGTGVSAPPTAAMRPSVTTTTPFWIFWPAPVSTVAPTMAMFWRGRPR